MRRPARSVRQDVLLGRVAGRSVRPRAPVARARTGIRHRSGAGRRLGRPPSRRTVDSAAPARRAACSGSSSRCRPMVRPPRKASPAPAGSATRSGRHQLLAPRPHHEIAVGDGERDEPGPGVEVTAGCDAARPVIGRLDAGHQTRPRGVRPHHVGRPEQPVAGRALDGLVQSVPATPSRSTGAPRCRGATARSAPFRRASPFARRRARCRWMVASARRGARDLGRSGR